jgi:hypothetical protein
MAALAPARKENYQCHAEEWAASVGDGFEPPDRVRAGRHCVTDSPPAGEAVSEGGGGTLRLCRIVDLSAGGDDFLSVLIRSWFAQLAPTRPPVKFYSARAASNRAITREISCIHFTPNASSATKSC